MKVVRVKKVIDGREYKVPMVLLSPFELGKFEDLAKQFYKQVGNDLDFRVEPYHVNEISYKEWMLSDYWLLENCWHELYCVIVLGIVLG